MRLRVPSAPEAAADALREAIITGRLKPGERLIEKKLATDFGIGQPTLREAFKELEYQGFIRRIPQRGTYVTKLGKEDFRKILEVRMVLELSAIDQAARNMTPSAEEELTLLVDEMGRAAEKFDLAAFHTSDVAFHRRVWSLTGNEYLEKALEGIAFRLFAFVILQRDPAARNEFLASTEQHRGILAGLRSGDPERARQAFLSNTVKFWSTYHDVPVSEDAFQTSDAGSIPLKGSNLEAIG
jgi:DNA-binding GntR family transcriptional regulator